MTLRTLLQSITLADRDDDLSCRFAPAGFRSPIVPTPDSRSVPLPKDWPANVRSALVCAVGLAHAAITVARGWAVNSRIARVRLAGENDLLKTEVALLNRELDLLRARFERIPPKNRPHFSPAQRLEVLQLKASRAWNSAQSLVACCSLLPLSPLGSSASKMTAPRLW